MQGFQGCPGSQMMDFSQKKDQTQGEVAGKIGSELRQWPVQMHLVSPLAPYFKGADVLLTADCVGYALGDYHRQYLKGKSLAIACPKLDEEQEVYVEKIVSWIDEAKINTLTVMIMQVPCCGGLLALAQEAAQKAKRKVPIKYLVVGIQGDILQEEWV
ncbi:MAG: 4Fe-4S ferredoxin [Thermodesulfobacteriota bacterium]